VLLENAADSAFVRTQEERDELRALVGAGAEAAGTTTVRDRSQH